MSTRSLAEQPTWLESSVVDPKRFDTGYYDPSLTVAERNFREQRNVKWKRMRSIGRVYNFGAYELTNRIRFVDKSLTGAVPFITVTNIFDLTVDFQSAPWIDEDSHKLLEASVCQPGTVLLSIAGTIGRAGVLPFNCSEYNANQAVAKIAVDPTESDPHFLTAYLSSSVGLAASKREAAGAVQKNLYIYNVEEIPVPCPPSSVRVAIGNKLRSAERLRDQANTNTIKAIAIISGYFGLGETKGIRPNPDGGCDHFAAFVDREFLGLFHGAQFYSPKRQLAVDTVQATGLAQRIGSMGRRVRQKGKRSAELGHIDPANVNENTGYWTSGGEEEGGDVALVGPGQMLFLRMRPYLNKTTINDTEMVVSGSPEFLIYSFDGIDAYYIALCMRQPWALAQVAEIASGDRPRVDGDFVDDVVIPWPSPSQRQEIGELYKSTFALRRRADDLVRQSIEDVEKLVLGKLDESHCIAEGRILAAEFCMGNL